MASISIKDVSVEFPIFDTQDHSIRAKFLGRLFNIQSNISSSTKVIHSLNKINLTVREGDAVGVFGHNGSGKTTLLRTIAGIYEPTRGVVKTRGRIRSLLSLGVGAEFTLSGRENLMRIGLLNGFSPEEIREITDEVIAFSELHTFIDLPMRTYSSGMIMRLFFSLLTAKSTDILLMDEFFATGDEAFTIKSTSRIENLLEASKILVFASNSLPLIDRYCNRFIEMRNGEMNEVQRPKR
jgi:lipopolysaccharide transport system ATP-binding protein